MDNITVTIGTTEVEAEPVNGTLEDGELLVESFNWKINGEVFKEASEPFEWTEEQLKEQVRSTWMEKEEWPDTCVKDWDETRFVNEDTIKWRILEFVWEEQPVKSAYIDSQLELDGSASAYVAKMKDDNLLACIGYESRAQVLVATHIGAKELSVHHGLSLHYSSDSGLDALFGEEQGSGETETEDDDEEEKEQITIQDQLSEADESE